MRALLCLALSLAAWGVSRAAFPQQARVPPVLSVHTDLVTLPVTVVDRGGTVVTGLGPDDFVVYDNGEPRRIEFFSDEDVPATIGLVIDGSGSMRSRHEQIVAAATAFAATSHPLDEFFVVNFNDRVWLGLPPAATFTADRGQLYASISTLPAEGMSALYDGLDRALDHLALGTRDRKALVVLSDGGDNASLQSLENVMQRARQSNAVVHAVILFDQDDREARPGVLKELARQTGGRALVPRRRDDVKSALVEIANELRSGYTIGFAPPDTSQAGFRPIRVIVNAGDGRRLIARTRAGYHAR